MTKLEDLVPPLELCKQIPDGEFEDSALVWACLSTKPDEIWDVLPRIAKGIGGLPAPTLEETLDAIAAVGYHNPTAYNGGGWWEVGCEDAPVDEDYDRMPDIKIERHRKSAATAALKLYLTIIPSTPSIPSEEPSE